MKIFNSTKIQLYKKALDVHAREHEAIAQNVANAQNQNYKRVKSDFSEELRAAVTQNLNKSDARHMEAQGSDGSIFNDESEEKVDLNKEMGQLAVTQIRFDFASTVLKRSYKALNASITGRTS